MSGNPGLSRWQETLYRCSWSIICGGKAFQTLFWGKVFNCFKQFISDSPRAGQYIQDISLSWYETTYHLIVYMWRIFLNSSDSSTCSNTCLNPLSHYIHISNDYLSKKMIMLVFCESTYSCPYNIVVNIYEVLFRIFRNSNLNIHNIVYRNMA